MGILGWNLLVKCVNWVQLKDDSTMKEAKCIATIQPLHGCGTCQVGQTVLIEWHYHRWMIYNSSGLFLYRHSQHNTEEREFFVKHSKKLSATKII